MTNYLEVTNLSKSFDSFQLHNISFTLPHEDGCIDWLSVFFGC